MGVEKPLVKKGLDIALCSAAATALNTIAGASLVKRLFRNDWDAQGGCRGFLATCAEAWGAIFTLASFAHLGNFLVNTPEPDSTNTLNTLLTTWATTICISEPVSLLAKVFLEKI